MYLLTRLHRSGRTLKITLPRAALAALNATAGQMIQIYQPAAGVLQLRNAHDAPALPRDPLEQPDLPYIEPATPNQPPQPNRGTTT